jgi:UDP-N-acetylglucosamine 2-epimerase
MVKYLEGLKTPPNISICEALKYTEMVQKMAACKFILTDSGSIQKTSPFFGKSTLVFRNEAEWKETETRGYSRLFKGNYEDKKYLANILHQEKRFYLNKSQLPSEIIYNKCVLFR